MNVTEDYPDPARKDSGSSKIRVALMSLFTVLAIAVVGLLGTITYHVALSRHEASQARVQAQADAAQAEQDEASYLSSLTVSVTTGVQSILDGNEDTRKYGIKFADDMVLVQLTKGGGEFRGLVTATTKRGTEVPVEVIAFSNPNMENHTYYHIESGSNLRLMTKAQEEEPEE